LDIKVITGLIGSAIAIGSLFVFQGQLIQRVDTLESRSAPNTKIIEQDIADLKSEVAVLKTIIEEMRQKEINPLMR
tara:strand:+ start:2604 stop:2831 length:228 start_codon:yes stop_codon:yes gene_type:complete